MLYLRKYKFWKQFTTCALWTKTNAWLCCIYENTNFESNSQLSKPQGSKYKCCVVSTKIQILKAIHNLLHGCINQWSVVLYLRKYKFWKQFTTSFSLISIAVWLCCIYENTNFESNSQPILGIWELGISCVVSTKIQILKAIHNWTLRNGRKTTVVLYLRKYKFWKQFTTVFFIVTEIYKLCCIYENTNFESNSQPSGIEIFVPLCCVVSTKIQILKAIHNHLNPKPPPALVVLYLRKYKFWKQFTTKLIRIHCSYGLCCIYENTNFESNSQLFRINRWPRFSCVVSTKIQILKAIHNLNCQEIWKCKVVLYLRKYKFWKQFTTTICFELKVLPLCCIYENTNFESNSQPKGDKDW